jgi:hypothetical protein
MKSIQKAYSRGHGLKFGSGDIENGQDIIDMIGKVDVPPVRGFPKDFKIELVDEYGNKVWDSPH